MGEEKSWRAEEVVNSYRGLFVQMSLVVDRKEISSKIKRRNTGAQALLRIDAAALHSSQFIRPF